MEKRIPLYPRLDYAKKLAKEFIIKSNVKTLPVNPFALCKQHGILIKSVKESEDIILEIDPFAIRQNPQCDAKTYFAKGHYVIIYDESVLSQGRIIWTIAHEIGHIVLKHLTDFAQTEIGQGLTDKENEVLEKEANTFASEFLAPAEVLLNCQCVKKEMIKNLCGLSEEAAFYREEYLKHYRQDDKFKHLDQEIRKQFYNLALLSNGIAPEQNIARHVLEQDQETGRIFNEWPYLLNCIKEKGNYNIYSALQSSIAKIDYDTLYIYSGSDDLEKWIKAEPFTEYIINLIWEKLGIEVLEVLIIDNYINHFFDIF